MTEFVNTLLSFFQREPAALLIDAVDILLVAFLFYRALLALRGTRAMQMGVGLGVLFLLYSISRSVGLTTIYSIFDTVLTYIVLIVVVVFQGDIRRFLVKVGRRPLFRGARSRERRVLDEVVSAATALAQKRIGALLVFERQASLDEFVEEGQVLEARLSKELLYSIFVPSYENPLHDGAVLVRNDRIWQAGAFLPLTRRTGVYSSFGTRHRAALGITDETDAVVVIISEERATTSLCVNGNIAQDLSAAALRSGLESLLYGGTAGDAWKAGIGGKADGGASSVATDAESEALPRAVEGVEDLSP